HAWRRSSRHDARRVRRLCGRAICDQPGFGQGNRPEARMIMCWDARQGRTLGPITEVAKRLQIDWIESVEHRFQFGARMAKHGECLALDHGAKSTGEASGECSQVRKRSGRIRVSFVDMDIRTIFADKALVTQNAALTSRRLHHFGGQRVEIAKLPGFDLQLNAPRNFPAHGDSPWIISAVRLAAAEAR